MQRYFALMRDPAALSQFLTGDWATRHSGQTAPAVADVQRQMWEDYAALGGQVPQGGPAGIPGFHAPDSIGPADRPFHGGTDPAGGFLSIPRPVVAGLGRVLTRWGATDFGGESGDVMHFDDMGGLGSALHAATAAARTRINTPPAGGATP